MTKIVRRRAMKENALAEIKQWQAKGLTMYSVVKETGWSFGTVQRAFHADDMNQYQELTETQSAKKRDRRDKASTPGVVDEEEIKRLYNLGYTTHRVQTALQLTSDAIAKINRIRRHDGIPILQKKRICRQEVDQGVAISNGLEKMTHLLEIMSREYHSLVTVPSSCRVEWDAGAAAVQKGLALFRRQVRTSNKGDTHDTRDQ
jgi:hypothetical protein